MESVQHALLAASGLLLLAASFRPERRFLFLGLLILFHTWDMQELSSHFIRMIDPSPFTTLPKIASQLPPADAPAPWRLYVQDSYAVNALSSFGYECLQGNHGFPMLAPQEILSAMAKHPQDYLDMFNVRYIFARSPLRVAEDGKELPFEIAVNPQALGGAWLVGEETLVQDQAKALQRVGMLSFHPESEVVLERDLHLGGGPTRGEIRWIRRSPNSFELEVHSERHAALVISNPWYPAWEARIDGKPTEVLEANAGLQAIDLPAGLHQVEFRFGAACLWLGFGLAFVGFLILLMAFQFRKGLRHQEAL